MYKRISTLTTLMALLISASVPALDVIGTTNTIVIESSQTSAGEDIRRFSYCEFQRQGEVCTVLGSRSNGFYSVAELESQKTWELVETVGSGVADLALVAGAIYGGIVAGTAAVGGNSAHFLASAVKLVGEIGGGASGLALGSGATYVGSKYIRALNPIAQYQDVQALEDRILNDEDFSLESIKVKELADTLDAVLTKLN